MGCGSSTPVSDRIYVNDPSPFKNFDNNLYNTRPEPPYRNNWISDREMFREMMGSSLSPLGPRLQVEIPVDNSTPITVFHYRC